MHWLEQKYLSLASNRLRNFKRKSGTLYNFSCPICGDSESNKTKARGYVYSKKGKTLFHCHNCGKTADFPRFLRELDQQLYSEFSLEKLKDESPKHQRDKELQEFVEKLKKPVFLRDGPLKGLRKISQLQPSHPAKKFVDSRKVPNLYHAKLFYCPEFFKWANSVVPGKFSDEAEGRDEGRVLIPFLDKRQSMHAFQGRSLDSKSKTRYITVVNDESVPKLYGLDQLDSTKRVYVFEGPFDSMFVPNSVATAGGDLTAAVKGLPRDKLVIVYDNEPRSLETRKKMEKAIINGYTVCVWPENLEHKDVNDMVLAGLSPEFVQYIIDTHSFRDLRARLELTKWSKA